MRQQPKRRPLLADLLIATEPRASIMDSRWLGHSVDVLRVAKKFVLDSQATRYLGQMIREHPRVIADAQDFALRPFERMWIEFPFPVLYHEITQQQGDSHSDNTVGYLFDGPLVKVAACASGNSRGNHAVWVGNKADFINVEYVLHRPMPPEEQLRLVQLMGTSRLALDLWFWGNTAASFIGHEYVNDEGVERLREWNREALKSLKRNHTVQLAPTRMDAKALTHEEWVSVRNTSAGDLRNIVALLLYLNRTADIRYEEHVPMAQQMIARRPRPLFPHSVIKLKLDPMPRLRKLGAGIGVRRRLHDVRGHFAHDRKARAGCMHGIERDGDFGEWWDEYEPLQWRCSGCGGKRWWRREHQRGDPKVGILREQRYEVTK